MLNWYSTVYLLSLLLVSTVVEQSISIEDGFTDLAESIIALAGSFTYVLKLADEFAMEHPQQSVMLPPL